MGKPRHKASFPNRCKAKPLWLQPVLVLCPLTLILHTEKSSSAGRWESYVVGAQFGTWKLVEIRFLYGMNEKSRKIHSEVTGVERFAHLEQGCCVCCFEAGHGAVPGFNGCWASGFIRFVELRCVI